MDVGENKKMNQYTVKKEPEKDYYIVIDENGVVKRATECEVWFHLKINLLEKELNELKQQLRKAK